jgi:chromosome segregation ATPase
MEKQLNDYQMRLLSMQRADSDLNKYKQEVDDLIQQRELDKRRLCELCERNAKLELDTKNLLNQHVCLERELTECEQRRAFAEGKYEQLLASTQQTTQTQLTQLVETNRLRLNEFEHANSELQGQLTSRDQELAKLRETLRTREASLDECAARARVLGEELSSEHEMRVRCERTLEQHKHEIRELQLKLDECVSETKKLDVTIREAAFSSEMKESENQANFTKLIESHEQLNDSYKKLITDHEQLQRIYLQMELDYEELYGELAGKHAELNALRVELDETRERGRVDAEHAAKVQARLSVFESRQYSEMAVNTVEDLNMERRELEKSYEVKFAELNREIDELIHKVTFFFSVVTRQLFF